MRGMLYLLLIVEALMSAFIAYHNNAWFTFFGATFGWLSYWFVYAFAMWVFNKAKLVEGKTLETKWPKALFKRLIRFSLLYFVSVDKRKETYKNLLNVTSLTKITVTTLSKEYTSSTYDLIFGGLSSAPLFYGRWFITGFVVEQTFVSIERKSSSLLLNIFLALLVALTLILEKFKETESETIRDLKRMLLISLQNKLAKLSLKITEEIGRFAYVKHEYILELKECSYSVERFVSNSWKFFTNIYGLVLVTFILAYISPAGCSLALVAAATSLIIIVFGGSEKKNRQKKLWLLKHKRDHLIELSADPDYQESMYRSSTTEVVAEGIIKLGEEQHTLEREGREDYLWLKDIGRIIFFTLFALSIFYTITDYQGSWIRLVILYIFSMMSMWWAIGNIALATGEIWSDLYKLDVIRRIFAFINKNESLTDPNEAGIENTNKNDTSTEITVNEFTYGKPGRPLVMKNLKSFSIPSTITTANIVRVLGSQSSIFLELLAANKGCRPMSGSIRIGSPPIEVKNVRRSILFIPKIIPKFRKGRIIDIFKQRIPEDLRNFVKESSRYPTELSIVESFLDKFGLLSQIKHEGQEEWTGGNLILGRNGFSFDENQNRLFFLALEYLTWKTQIKKGLIRPRLIVLDGIDLIKAEKQRIKIVKIFEGLATEARATLIVSAKDIREIGTIRKEDEFVILCEGPEDRIIPADEEPEPCSLLRFNTHGNFANHFIPADKKKYLDFVSPANPRN